MSRSSARQHGYSTIRFGPHEIDLRSGELRRHNHLVRLQEKPFQLLACLLERPGEMVTRQELRSRLWAADTYVGFDDSLNHAVRKLRTALQDSAEKPTYIETIPKRGYRFIASLQASPLIRLTIPDEAPAGSHLPLVVGRDSHLAQLLEIFAQVKSGRGMMLGIQGEPGIGKTTLLDLFRRRIASAAVGLGRCSERFAGTEAYLPVVEALESLTAQSPEARAMLRETAPSWYSQLEHPDPDDPSPAVTAEVRGASQERRKREFATFLEEAARLRPLVMLFDDVQWADCFTVDLLSYAAARCGSTPILFLCAFRSSELAAADHPFRWVKAELQTRRLYQEQALSSLLPGDIAQYLHLSFPCNSFPDTFAGWLHRHTEGSPLFLVDLVRDLQASGMIAKVEGAWRITADLTDCITVPASVRGMVERKMASLSCSDRRLLEVASVQGHRFRSITVAGVMGMPVEEIEARLKELEAKRQVVVREEVEELPDNTVSLRYRFAHALYQSSLLEDIGPNALVALSHASACALEAAFGDKRAAIASELAYLMVAAREWECAADYFLLAADEAAARSAGPTAVALAAKAIENAAKLPPESRDPRVVRAALLRSRQHHTMSMFDEALADCALAEDTAARLGDTESVLEAITSSGLCYFYLRDMRSMATQGRRALDIASPGRCVIGRASAQVVLSLDCLSRGDLDSMRDYLEQAIPVVQDSGPPLVSQVATSFRGFLHTLQSEYEAAEPLLGSALEKAYSTGIPSEVARILWVRGLVSANLGRFSESIRALREGARVAGNNQTVHWSARFPNTLAWIYAEIGDWEQSHHLNEEGIAISRNSGIPEPEANSRINLASLLCERGRLAAAAEQLQESENLLNQRDEKVWMRWRFNIRLRAASASYWLLRGDLGKAHQSASLSLDLASAARARKHAASARKILGDIALSSGNPDQALREYLAGLTLLKLHPCPLVEWKLLAGAVAASPENAEAESWRARALAFLLHLASHIEAPAESRRFLESGRAKLAR